MSSKTYSKTDTLITSRNEMVKQHVVLDASSRAKFVFTAALNTPNGGTCEVTEYIYVSPSSTIIIGRQEQKGVWNTAWETNFTYDPTVSYDPDGDGVL